MGNSGGLDPQALAVYRAMLRYPDLSTGELAEKADVSEAELSSAVTELKSLGFIAFGPGDLDRPVTPDSALALYATAEWARAKSLVDGVAALTALLPKMAADHDAGLQRSSGLLEFEVVRGPEGPVNKLYELVDQTVDDYCFLVNTQPADRLPSRSDADDEPIAKLAKRGGRVRVVMPSRFREPDLYRGVLVDMKHGQQVRFAGEDMPPMFAVFDNAAALVPLDPEDTAKAAIVVRSRGIVLALRRLFEDYWRECTPAVAVKPGGAGRQSEILRMLSAGSKDEAIGRALGVGLRTIRREISDLMDEYGANSRFQLGILIAERRLHSPDSESSPS